MTCAHQAADLFNFKRHRDSTNGCALSTACRLGDAVSQAGASGLHGCKVEHTGIEQTTAWDVNEITWQDLGPSTVRPTHASPFQHERPLAHSPTRPLAHLPSRW